MGAKKEAHDCLTWSRMRRGNGLGESNEVLKGKNKMVLFKEYNIENKENVK